MTPKLPWIAALFLVAGCQPDREGAATGDDFAEASAGLCSPRLRVRALIDGRSQLTVRGDSASWYHLDQAAPGRSGTSREPTYLNGTAWLPGWPDVPDAANRDCGCRSSRYTGLERLRTEGRLVTVEVIEGRGRAALVRHPAPGDETVTLELDDDATPGPAWYEVVLGIRPPSDNCERRCLQSHSRCRRRCERLPRAQQAPCEARCSLELASCLSSCAPDLSTPPDLSTSPDLSTPPDGSLCAPEFSGCQVPPRGQGQCCAVGVGCSPPALPPCASPTRCVRMNGYLQMYGCGTGNVCRDPTHPINVWYNRAAYQVCQELATGDSCAGPPWIESTMNTACLPCCPS